MTDRRRLDSGCCQREHKGNKMEQAMRDTQAVIERTQQILAKNRACRERCDADHEVLKARIELAQVTKGQLHLPERCKDRGVWSSPQQQGMKTVRCPCLNTSVSMAQRLSAMPVGEVVCG